MEDSPMKLKSPLGLYSTAHRLLLSLYLTCSWACEDKGDPPTEPEAGTMLAGGERVINPEDGGESAGESAGDVAGEDIDLAMIKLNEVASKGDPHDWVELHNMGMNDVNLSGYWISDKADQPNRFILPDGVESVVPAQGFALLILDGDSTGFSLSGNEGVYLSTPTGTLIDQIEYTAELSIPTTTLGRLPDGIGEWQLLFEPTPSAPNMAGQPPECGDGICDPNELCEVDCVVCGDGLCDFGEVCELDCQIEIPLIINEIIASGEPDGAEIVNLGDEVIDLSKIYITDDRQSPMKGQLEGMLEPNTYLWVEISDETLGFRLKGDEELSLFDEDALMIDGVDWEEGDSPEGLSFARSPNLTGAFVTGQPSPGQPND